MCDHFSQKNQRHAQAYIDFKSPEDVVEFAEFFDGRVFVNEKGNDCVRHHAVFFYLSDAYVVYVRWDCIFLYLVLVLSKSHGQNGFSRNVSNLWSPHLSYVVCPTSDYGCGSGSLESIILQFFFRWWKLIHERKHFWCRP